MTINSQKIVSNSNFLFKQLKKSEKASEKLNLVNNTSQDVKNHSFTEKNQSYFKMINHLKNEIMQLEEQFSKNQFLNEQFKQLSTMDFNTQQELNLYLNQKLYQQKPILLDYIHTESPINEQLNRLQQSLSEEKESLNRHYQLLEIKNQNILSVLSTQSSQEVDLNTVEPQKLLNSIKESYKLNIKKLF